MAADSQRKTPKSSKESRVRQHYVISYDLEVAEGEDRDYDGVAKVLKEMGAVRMLKSQWLVEYSKETSAKVVAEKFLSECGKVKGSDGKPAFQSSRDSVYVTPFFPFDSESIAIQRPGKSILLL